MSNEGWTMAMAPAAGVPNKRDPFNYPFPGRKDTMNLSNITRDADNMKTSTVKFTSTRSSSHNMFTRDIEGAVPKLHGNKKVDDNK